MQTRILNWEGCNNVRDLGGLRTPDGRLTRFQAIVRSDTPARLTSHGWQALYDYGIRTIITLRTHGMAEDDLKVVPPYPDLTVIEAPIEDITDQEFMAKWVENGLWSTPLYYQDALQRWPERHAAVITAIAQAGAGGVLFHCIRGYDRTGIIALQILALAGVAPDEIIADYQLSLDTLRDEELARRQTSTPEVIRSALAALDIEQTLRQGGASQADLEAVRQRLLE